MESFEDRLIEMFENRISTLEEISAKQLKQQNELLGIVTQLLKEWNDYKNWIKGSIPQNLQKFPQGNDFNL